MKPGVSLQATGSLPSRCANANAVSKASSLVCAVRTTSTSGSTGAGLKKCMPTTRSGVCVAVGDLRDRERRRVGGQDRGRGDEAVELAEQLALDLEVLEGGLDHELAVRQVGELGGQRQPSERGVLLVLASAGPSRRRGRGSGRSGRAPARRARPRPRGRRPRSRPAGRPARSRHPSCRARRPRRERSPRRAILSPLRQQPLPAHLALGLDHRSRARRERPRAPLASASCRFVFGSQPAKYISTPSHSPRQPGIVRAREAREEPAAGAQPLRDAPHERWRVPAAAGCSARRGRRRRRSSPAAGRSG